MNQFTKLCSRHWRPPLRLHPSCQRVVTRNIAAQSGTSSSDYLSQLKEDMKVLHQRTRRVLQEYIRHPGMYAIATYYYTGPKDDFLIWTGFPLVVAKALNYHLFKDAHLTEAQLGVLTTCQLTTIFYLLNDDMVDNAMVRFNRPSASAVWCPGQVIRAANMVMGVSVQEAARLSPDIAVSFCQMHECQYRGQYLTEELRAGPKDELTQYLLRTDYKGGCTLHFVLKALCQAVDAGPSLTDTISRMGTALGMMVQVMDDYKDLEADLKDGVATAPVLLALSGEPRLQTMMARRFQGAGDLQEALRLVRLSRGLDQTRALGETLLRTGIFHLNTLAPSAHRDVMEQLLSVQFYRKYHCHEASSA